MNIYDKALSLTVLAAIDVLPRTLPLSEWLALIITHRVLSQKGIGYAVAPCPLIPEAVTRHPELHGMMACLNAARMCEALELAAAICGFQHLIGLPEPVAFHR